jgi:hypothetical protein
MLRCTYITLAQMHKTATIMDKTASLHNPQSDQDIWLMTHVSYGGKVQARHSSLHPLEFFGEVKKGEIVSVLN